MSGNEELSTELYVNQEGLLIETETYQNVTGIVLMYDEQTCEAWFQYITPLITGDN
tara:strand:- start:550 stop:717 length:168 start_codon:yes stop_codon:yes gene_type:complete